MPDQYRRSYEMKNNRNKSKTTKERPLQKIQQQKCMKIDGTQSDNHWLELPIEFLRSPDEFEPSNVECTMNACQLLGSNDPGTKVSKS